MRIEIPCCISEGMHSRERLVKFVALNENDVIQAFVYESDVNEKDGFFVADVVDVEDGNVLIELSTDSSEGRKKYWISSPRMYGTEEGSKRAIANYYNGKV